MSRNKNILQRVAAAATIAAAAASCGITGNRGNGDDNYFSAFESFSNAEWLYAEPVRLRVDTLRDSIATGGTLLLTLRHTDAYAYGNIWLELSYPATDSTTQADTFNIALADVYGHWLGRGSGPSLQLVDTLAINFSIARGDTLTIRHIMRLDTLPNIEQVGLVFIPE